MHPNRCIRHASVLVTAMVPALALGGCLARPVTDQSPDTVTVFSQMVDQTAVQRLDLLFMIDNSKSMGDKQDYLASAVPDLLQRLITPNCVDPTDLTSVVGVSADGVCSAGVLEFPPVHDMHIAVLSSALGSLGGDVCPDPSGAAQGTPDGQNDYGHLLNGSNVADAPDDFLAWFPQTSANDGSSPTPGTPPAKDAPTLIGDFQQLVQGVGEGGCGIEAQLESWYRFLVQPDPFLSVATSGNTSTLTGIDATVLEQRHDFLRPDSLLAIIDMSDENDSSVDPRVFNGTEVAGFHINELETGPFKGTAACTTNPNDPSCTSCASTSAASLPECQPARYETTDPQGTPNIRHVHMKQAFGLDSQYPMQRYVDGLTSTTVPDQAGEYPPGQTSAPTYQGVKDCSNPIFSQNLPDGSDTSADTLCHLQPGPRTPDLVYYAHIGGVPTDLLHYDPNSPQNSALSAADWVKILGNDPTTYDTSGVDPRMAETYQQRPYDEAPFQTYWDLAYSCTFQLTTPRDCTAVGAADGCDCATSTPPASVTGWELCDPSNPTQQIEAKAYPTFRELYLAKLMGAQGIVSSLCPIHVTEQGTNDPLYGYRPAMASIIDRLKTSLAGQCIPHTLTGDQPCLVLASLPQPGATCDPNQGLSPADPATVAAAVQSLQGQADAALFDPTQHTVCQVAEITGLDGGSCAQSSAPGWCYVTGPAAGQCPGAILFSPSGQPATGVETLMTCIESTPSVTGGS
jgi:hypothetical protein